MTDPSTLTMEPGSLLNVDGNYCMQQKTTYSLMKYMWTGVLLATNMDDFKARIGVTDIEASLVPMVQNLLDTYGQIATHCEYFKDTTYPSVVHLADDVYTYAQTAGGTADDSFYAAIISTYLQLVDELAKPLPDPQKVATLQTSIKQLIANEVSQIEQLRTTATGVTSALRAFEGQTMQDQQALSISQTALTDQLTGDGGEISRLNDIIKNELDELAADQAEYEHDVIVACTSLTYGWIWPCGTVAAGVVMGVYSADALKMQAAMSAINILIDGNRAQVQAEQHLIADISLIMTSLQNVSSLIGPAVQAIEAMMGYWDSVASDLQAIETFVETNSATGTALVQKLEQNHILAMWNTLADSVDKYRKAAFISDVDMTTLGQWEADVGKAKTTASLIKTLGLNAARLN